MTVQHDTTSVHHEIDVEVSPTRAYQVFTQRFDEIKPRDHNLLAADIAETVLEPWPGGRIYDRGVDGSTCQWGRVLLAEPPQRLVFAWDISPQWQVQSDPTAASEVEITFTTVGDTTTRVTIEHRHLDRHGPGWTSERDAVDGEHGWPVYLGRFRTAVGARGR